MFIVIDIFNPTFPHIVSDEDGCPLLFDTKDDAQSEADECQIAIVVEI